MNRLLNRSRLIRGIALLVLCAAAGGARARDVYVATNGSDAGSGAYASPFRTFAHAVAQLNAGDTLLIGGGTYVEPLVLNRGGTSNALVRVMPADDNAPVVIDLAGLSGSCVSITASNVWIEGLEARNSDEMGVRIHGAHVTCRAMKVHDIETHGIYTDGPHTRIAENEVYLTNLENAGRSWSSGWGSGIKVRIGGNDTLIERNRVYHNYGEGIAVTRGIGAVVRDNRVFDNFAVQIYVDNSADVLVEGNLCLCNGPTGFEYLDGSLASGISLAEEYYAGWGAQLSNVTVRNNIAAFCERNLTYYGSDVSGAGGLSHVQIVNNTFWGSSNTAVSIAYERYKVTNSIIANNLVQQPAGKVAWIENRNGLDLHHNFWVGAVPDAWRNCNGSNDLSGEVALLGAPGTNASSFRLSSSSSARDSAHGACAPPLDYEGKLRAHAASPSVDRGALEYGEPDDGIPDAWEARYATNRLDLLGDEDDADGDGLTDRQEYLIGSDPFTGQAHPRVDFASAPAGTGLVELIWTPAATDRWCRVEYATNLAGASFVPLRRLWGTGRFLDERASESPTRYYRIRLSP